ncbi:hypothetical protein K7X08_032491 [Anisodus acutangulus]|uniref:Cycloidea-like protein n=1 Tax=Anisodus acutangulus TaxID=402998 RepID=A0A9Q1R536_9SOLA|nr:hypothetical protein K7X08_032491 [Anisodus acutangulus]
MQYEHDLLFQYYQDHLLQHPQTPFPTAHDDKNILDDALAESTETAINMADSNKEEEVKVCKNKKAELSSTTSIPRNNRTCKKDRHSKINTARGPRDRRIRLSIDIARKIFSLQDILRFEKASKAVEWLLIKSKSAIKELSRGPLQQSNSASSTSECEVLSGIDESPSNNQNHKKNGKGNSKKKKAKSARIRAAFHHPFAKESRKQARERARERTKLKKSFGGSKLRFEAMAHDLNLKSWSFFERGEQSVHTSANHPSHGMQADVEDFTSHHKKQLLLGTKENSTVNNDFNLVATGNWNPYTIFNYQHNAGTLHEQHQNADFQFS